MTSRASNVFSYDICLTTVFKLKFFLNYFPCFKHKLEKFLLKYSLELSTDYQIILNFILQFNNLLRNFRRK